MVIVYPDRVKSKNYICHPGVIKKMLMNLQKLEDYNEFFKQYTLIYMLLWKRYYVKHNVFRDPGAFFIVQLLNFLKVDDCISSAYASMTFYEHEYSDIIIQTWILVQKLAECPKVLVPFIITFDDETSHANLLIFDNKQIYRVEPNAGFESYEKKYNTAITNRLEHFAQKIGYTYNGYLPSACQRMWHPGLCIFLSVLKYTVGISLTQDQVKKTIVEFFKSEYNRICFKSLKGI